MEKLSAAGMSSDDSDGEDNTRTVRKVVWRSRKILEVLKAVDRDANTLGRFGGARPGNPGKPRKRRATALTSRRNAIPGLPINFYDETWLSTLKDRERAELNAQKPFPIPEIVCD